MTTIGQALAAWRVREGKIIREAAASAQVDPAQWSRWERGALNPSPLNRERLVREGILTEVEAALPCAEAAA